MFNHEKTVMTTDCPNTALQSNEQSTAPVKFNYCTVLPQLTTVIKYSQSN